MPPLTASRLALAALVILAGGGCASLGKPDWLQPGPSRSQQRKAVRYDP